LVDLHLLDLALAVGADDHHPSAARAGDGLASQPLLRLAHLLLELLRLLQERVQIESGHALLLSQIADVLALAAEDLVRRANSRVLAGARDPALGCRRPQLLLLLG